MKNYKSLSRIFILSYLTSLFGGMLFGMLLIKNNGVAATFMIILSVLDLAAIITARVFFSKNFKAYLILSASGFSILTMLVLAGFITEIIYTVNGLPAYYAWMIGIINLIFVILIDAFYVLNLLKLRHDRLVELGVIKPVEEDI